jgi:hypothetical protein
MNPSSNIVHNNPQGLIHKLKCDSRDILALCAMAQTVLASRLELTPDPAQKPGTLGIAAEQPHGNQYLARRVALNFVGWRHETLILSGYKPR